VVGHTTKHMTHSNLWDMEIGLPSVEDVTRGRAAPSCDMFNLGSSYFHVPLTTVRHLLNVTLTTVHQMYNVATLPCEISMFKKLACPSSNWSKLVSEAVLSYDLSLITIHISHYHQFSDIHISQGSAATCVRCGEVFKYVFVANLPLSPSAK